MSHNGSTIVLKEHVLSLTGDSFSIKTADGTPILQVEGKLMSISGRKKVTDMGGNHLFDIVKEHLHIHTTFAIEDPQKQKLMEVKSSFKCKLGRPFHRVIYGSEDLTNTYSVRKQCNSHIPFRRSKRPHLEDERFDIRYERRNHR